VARCGAGRDEQRRGTVCVPHTRGCAHETQSDRGQRTAPQSGRRQHERRGTEYMLPAVVQGGDGVGEGGGAHDAKEACGAKDGLGDPAVAQGTAVGGVERRGREGGRLGPE
jgi:hypothetical protein